MQLIIVYIILAITISYGVYAVVKSVQKKEPNPCDGCDGCDLKKEIAQNCEKKKDEESSSCNSH